MESNMGQSLNDLRKQLTEKNTIIDNMKTKMKDFVQSLHNGDFNCAYPPAIIYLCDKFLNLQNMQKN